MWGHDSVSVGPLVIMETITCPLPEWIALKSNDRLSLLFSDTSRHGLTHTRQARGCLYRQEIITIRPLSSAAARRLITVSAPYFVNSVSAFCTARGGCIDNACTTLLVALFQ